MATQQDVVSQDRENQPVESQRKITLRPSVDIFENDDSIKLFADLPGAAEKDLNLQVDGNTLTIGGDIEIDIPENMESLFADVRATHYQRAFTLSSELDTTNIDASLKNGLLSVSIPKREEVRPRSIEVKAG